MTFGKIKGAALFEPPLELFCFGFLKELRAFFRYPSRETLHKADFEGGKPLERQGPYRACKGYDKEISDASCNELVAKEGYEGRGESRLNDKNATQTKHELDYLCIPARVGLEVYEFRVDKVNEHESCRTAEKRAGVFQSALVIMGVKRRISGY